MDTCQADCMVVESYTTDGPWNPWPTIMLYPIYAQPASSDKVKSVTYQLDRPGPPIEFFGWEED